MPLIVISGLPCSRKTTVAEYLKSYFEKVKNMKAILVTEENFYRSEDRNSIYSGSSYTVFLFFFKHARPVIFNIFF